MTCGVKKTRAARYFSWKSLHNSTTWYAFLPFLLALQFLWKDEMMPPFPELLFASGKSWNIFFSFPRSLNNSLTFFCSFRHLFLCHRWQRWYYHLKGIFFIPLHNTSLFFSFFIGNTLFSLPTRLPTSRRSSPKSRTRTRVSPTGSDWKLTTRSGIYASFLFPCALLLMLLFAHSQIQHQAPQLEKNQIEPLNLVLVH